MHSGNLDFQVVNYNTDHTRRCLGVRMLGFKFFYFLFLSINSEWLQCHVAENTQHLGHRLLVCSLL